MSCDLDVTNESARCWEKTSSYITMVLMDHQGCYEGSVCVGLLRPEAQTLTLSYIRFLARFFIPRRDRKQRTLWTMLSWLRRRRITWPRFPSTFHLLFINIYTYFLIWDMSIGISRSPFVLDLILKLSNNWAIFLWSNLPKNNRHGGAIGYAFSTLSVFLYDEQFKQMAWG